MAVWSSLALKNIGKLNLARSLPLFRSTPKTTVLKNVPVRYGHVKIFPIRESDYLFRKSKDLIILYFLLGAIPLSGIALYTSLFIGPATLAVIPEGYDPQPWEYYENPITRFLAKIIPSQQENYERNLHCVFKQNEMRALSVLRAKVEELIKKRQDYQAWYYVKPTVKYVRHTKEQVEDMLEGQGVLNNWIK